MNLASYEAWNRALAQFFYSPASAGKLVYLQVDSDTLRDIGRYANVESGQAEISFVHAVRSKLLPDQWDPFAGFLRDARYWHRQLKDEALTPPPFLGLLGICVLAASKMCSDSRRRVRSNNYYAWFNELLGLDLNQMPENVTCLWAQLNEWLEINKGALGLPTATSQSWFRHTGYPLSQCLLRNVDRQRLPDFFRWGGLNSGDNVSGKDLVPHLELWVSRTTCTFSEHGKTIFGRHKDLTGQAAEVVAVELKLWNGGSIDTEGRHSARIELHLEVQQGGRLHRCELYPKAPEGFPEGEYRAGNTGVGLKRLSGVQWFEPLPDDFLAEAFASGLVLRKEKYALQFQPAPVIPLGEHLELGGWVSCGRVNMGERYIILCRNDYEDQVKEYLAEYAEAGWKQSLGSQGLPSGWLCFRNVRIVALAKECKEDLDCLVPRLRVGIQLAGGLKVGQDIWLKGGEPEALITTQEEGQQVAVRIDGHNFKSLSTGTGVVELIKLDLAPGEHEIVAGTQRRRFHLCTSGYCPTRLTEGDALGYIMHRCEGASHPTSLGPISISQQDRSEPGQLSIIGARIIGLPQETHALTQEVLILQLGYKRYIILGKRPGEIVEYRFKSELPYWFLRKCGFLQGEFKITVSFTPQWLIKIGPKRRKHISPVGHPESPEPTIADESKLASWVRWAKKKRFHNWKAQQEYLDLWEEYRMVAIGLGG